jgi:hypothetical protein
VFSASSLQFTASRALVIRSVARLAVGTSSPQIISSTSSRMASAILAVSVVPVFWRLSHAVVEQKMY